MDVMDYKTESIYFTTFTINKWVPVFYDLPETNFIILESFQHLSNTYQLKIYAFVIMRDHIHLLWYLPSQQDIAKMFKNFKQYTGKEIMKKVLEINEDYLGNFISQRTDREHKLWKLKSSHLRIQHPIIFKQKLNYIHLNPCKGDYKTVEEPELYLFSSAKAYFHQYSNFSFLTFLHL